jgi:DNA (cytosine-5)-methyltransferase 1
MFAGIGGFRAGLTRAGGFQCVGHCEIDRFAEASYRAIHDIQEGECFYPDARKIDPRELPEFDLLCGGFPCQAFSISGKRKGFEDARGTLFFEAARVLKARKPAYFLLENVPGLLSHDKGRTFSTILATQGSHKVLALWEKEPQGSVWNFRLQPEMEQSGLCGDAGYGVEWCVCNSKYFGVPQSRRRVFIIGYLNPKCAGKIFPLAKTTGKDLVQIIKGSQGSRVYDPEGIACTQVSQAGGMGGKTGLYFIDLCKGNPKQTEIARCITADYGKAQVSNRKGEMSGVLFVREGTKCGYKAAKSGDSINFSYAGNHSKRGRVGDNIAHTLDTSCLQGVVTRTGRVRRLTPGECLRLQGFDKQQIDRLLAITSDCQAYKQAGNSVTVNVIEAIGHRIREMDEELKRGGG